MPTDSNVPTEPALLRRRELGPIQDLLLMACKPTPDGCVSIPLFAAQMPLHRVTVYGWIRRDGIPLRYAARILELAEGRVSRAGLAPFLER